MNYEIHSGSDGIDGKLSIVAHQLNLLAFFS